MILYKVGEYVYTDPERYTGRARRIVEYISSDLFGPCYLLETHPESDERYDLQLWQHVDLHPAKLPKYIVGDIVRSNTIGLFYNILTVDNTTGTYSIRQVLWSGSEFAPILTMPQERLEKDYTYYIASEK